jgi:hypothetical protein
VRVLKYPIKSETMIPRLVKIAMPEHAKIVHVAEQNGAPTMWAETDHRSGPDVQRTFIVLATGEQLSLAKDYRRYVGTVHVDWTVWHIFEVLGDTTLEQIGDEWVPTR